jgi:hypothetical protein
VSVVRAPQRDGPQVVAVDVSIWLTQFIKAMRDDQGQMLHNAHLVGTFRRICKVRAGMGRAFSGALPT